MENTINENNTEVTWVEKERMQTRVVFSYQLFAHLIYDLGLLHLFVKTGINDKNPLKTVYIFKSTDELNYAIDEYTEQSKARQRYIEHV